MIHRDPISVTHQVWGRTVCRCSNRSTHTTVWWINKLKWEFEPRVWNFTTWQCQWLLEWLCLQSNAIGGCWLILAFFYVGLWHAPLASSSFFIISECHCKLGVGTWQTSLTFFLCSKHLRLATFRTSVSFQLSSFVFSPFCYSYFFLVPLNNFHLETMTALTPTLFTVPFYYHRVLSQSM